MLSVAAVNLMRTRIRRSDVIRRQFGIKPILMTQFNDIRWDNELFLNAFQSKPQGLNPTQFAELYAITNQIVRDVAKATKRIFD